MKREEVELTAIILTKNEESKIENCLKSLSFCDEIIVVDDYSTDNTVQIAEKYTENIVKHKLNNDFTQQRNYAMSLAKGEWILFVDADEEVSSELRYQLMKALDEKKLNRQAYYIPRRDYWWGREIRYGDISLARQRGFIRLVKKNSGKWMGKVHERYVINSFVGKFKGFLNHYPHPTVADFIRDINYYSSIRARELYNEKKRTNVFEILTFPTGKFLVNYFINLGFLDGAAGFAYAFFMSFHSFLVRAKLYQYTTFPQRNDS